MKQTKSTTQGGKTQKKAEAKRTSGKTKKGVRVRVYLLPALCLLGKGSEREGANNQTFQGPELKGPELLTPSILPKDEHRNESRTNKPQRQARNQVNIRKTARGVAGPMGRPLPSGSHLRDRSTEGAETPPATGTALKKHLSDTNAEPTLDPEGHVPTLSRLYTHLTQLTTTRQIHPRQSIQTSSHAHTDERIAHYSNTHKQTLRAVSRGTTWR